MPRTGHCNRSPIGPRSHHAISVAEAPVLLSHLAAGSTATESIICQDSPQHLEAEMDLRGATDSESRFAAYVEGLVGVCGPADRAKPLRDYCVGLMMPCERKSVEPMAAVTAPARVSAQHQSLLHFIGEGR